MLLEELRQDFVNLNRDQKFYILAFEFEMLIEDSLARSVGAKMSKSVKELYSASKPLSPTDLKGVESTLGEISQAPIYYVDTAGTVKQIVDTILDFSAKVSKEDGLVVTLDHALLTKGAQTDMEKVIIDDLMRNFVDLKKSFAQKGLRIIFVVLTQLNREIEKPERVANQFLHYPTRNDIFASSSVYTCSDYVVITHRPSVVPGMREWYGPPSELEGKAYPKGLPVYTPDRSASMVYWHIIKERFGQLKVLTFIEDFKHSRLIPT